MSTTINEQLADMAAKLEGLLPGEEITEELQVSAQELLAKVAAELAMPVTKKRAAYLQEVVAKANWEGANTYIAIKVVNDPLRQKEGTESIPALGTLSSSPPGNTNWSYAQKADLIAKLLQDPKKLGEFIEKSALTDKLDDIKEMFAISDDDLKSDYEVSWKVGDLIRALQTAIKVERLVQKAAGDAGTEQTDPQTEKQPEIDPEKKDDEKKDGEKQPPSGDPPTKEDPQTAANYWPSDMAAAEFDPVAKNFKRGTTEWGIDSALVSRR